MPMIFRLGRWAAFAVAGLGLALPWTLVGSAHAAEGDLLAVPKLEHRVTDLTATLSSADEARIETRIREFQAAKGAQIAVLLVGTTQPEPIFDYALRVAEAWKLGRKGVDDGVLFVIAKNDRKMQILTGPGIQGVMTDAVSKRIIAEVVAPKFRAGNFAGGIEDGVAKIIDVINGEALPAPPPKRAASAGADYEVFLVLAAIAAALIGSLLRALLGRFLGAGIMGATTGAAAWWVVGGLIFPWVAAAIAVIIVLLSDSGGPNRSGRGLGSIGGWSGGGSSSSGGWSGGGSSDSFSGGGGSFDGGGASGDW